MVFDRVIPNGARFLETHCSDGTNYLFGGPLEASNNTVLYIVQILDSFCDVDHNVGPSGPKHQILRTSVTS